jgi:hypothetical protein
MTRTYFLAALLQPWLGSVPCPSLLLSAFANLRLGADHLALPFTWPSIIRTGLSQLPQNHVFSRFWNAICSGQVLENNRILSFVIEDVSWMPYEDLPLIYERDVYKSIFDDLYTGDLKKMLVLGTSGIGKSLLGF